MADSDNGEMDLAALRKSRSRFQSAATRSRNKLQTTLDEEDPLSLDSHQLVERFAALETTFQRGNRVHDSIALEETDEARQEADLVAKELFHDIIWKAKMLCKRLQALKAATLLARRLDKSVHSLEDKRASNPGKDYSLSVQQLREMEKELSDILCFSTIPSHHNLWTVASDCGDRIHDLQATEATPSSISSDHSFTSDSFTKLKANSYRMPKIDIPHFNGEMKNWHAFWIQFREAVHNSDQMSDSTKLIFLRQSMDDPALRDLLCCETEEEDFYSKMVEVLKKRFDKPRDLHALHLKTLADLQPVKHNKQDLSQLADAVFGAVTGIIRQGQTDIKAIAISLVVSVLPKQLRTEWENKTKDSRDVPDVFEWITFVRQKASNSGYEQKNAPASHPQEQKSGGKYQSYHKQKASVNFSTPQRSKSPPQPHLTTVHLGNNVQDLHNVLNKATQDEHLNRQETMDLEAASSGVRVILPAGIHVGYAMLTISYICAVPF